MSRFLVVVVLAATGLATSAAAEPSDTKPPMLSAITVSVAPTADATVAVRSPKRDQVYTPLRCRAAQDEVTAAETAGQYLMRRTPDDRAVSMTLLHALSTPTWVTPMAHQLAQFDEDTINNEAVDITLLLANDVSIELVDVGLEVSNAEQDVVRARTHVRLPRQAIDALAASPVVRVTWTVDGVDYPASLSRHQGQKWYQHPFACIAVGLL
jgi:hypothetical protein